MDDGQLFCIEYPATVKNDDKMLETLGGYQHINETFSQPNRKLELKFRPETPGKHKEAFSTLVESLTQMTHIDFTNFEISLVNYINLLKLRVSYIINFQRIRR